MDEASSGRQGDHTSLEQQHSLRSCLEGVKGPCRKKRKKRRVKLGVFICIELDDSLKDRIGILV